MGLSRRTGSERVLALGLAFLLSLPSWSTPAAATDSEERIPGAVVGRLVEPEQGRVVVRRRVCHCDDPEAASADVVLLTVGTETPREEGRHFHPLATLAFDRTLAPPDQPEENPGRWMALWLYGPSPPGWRRTLRALLPLPVGAPEASEQKLSELEERLDVLRANPEEASRQVPDPTVHLAELGRMPRSRGVLGALRRGLAWANAINPAQFLFRTYLERREDYRERVFQRAYLALKWLLSAEYTGEEEKTWLAAVNELRFHLLSTRSFFGRWVPHGESLELIYNYESRVRTQLAKTSSWLQTAANEHYLRYQPVHRYTANGTRTPVAGVLYYDPQLGVEADPAWWDVANPFDLPYNPHRHPAIQRLAEQHPDKWIPLAVYTFQTELPLKPVIAIDFFAPGNPRKRESAQQLMVLVKNWLALTTGTFSLERIPYRLIAWGANKKGFAFLLDKSSRLGIEEFRLALEASLYFDPQVRPLLMHRADQRVLNPLIKASPVEERLAAIQYRSLLAEEARAVCERIADLRREMAERLAVPDEWPAAERRRELARRLVAWDEQVKLQDFVEHPHADFGSLKRLEDPLSFFLQAEAPRPDELEELLADLYRTLYIRRLRLPGHQTVAELESTLYLTRQAWERAAEAAGKDYEQRRARTEAEARQQERAERRRREQQRREALRAFLEESHTQLGQAVEAGCRTTTTGPAELEAHLVMLWEVAQEARTDEKLGALFQRAARRLENDLGRLEDSLAACAADPSDSWQAERQRNHLEMTRALQQLLRQDRRIQALRGD